MVNDVLTAFSPANDFLAITTADGRIKTWDVGSGHLRGEFVDIAASTSGAGRSVEEVNGHLAIDYTSIAWGSLPFTSKKGKKKGAKDGLFLVLVLGTGAGDILAWDTVLGQLRWRTNDCNSGGVKSLAFSKNGQTLYTAGADGMICELNSETGEVLGKFRAGKTPVSCIAISPDGGSLLAASSELKLFDLSSKKRIRKFAGHPAAVNAMVFSQDGKHVFSSGTGERQVAVWQVEGSKSQRGAIFSLSLDHPAVALDCSASKQEVVFKVVALSANGVAYIWQASTVEELAAMKPMKVSVATTKRAKVNKGVKPSILAACLETATGEDPQTVLVAHGTTARPNFEHVVVGAPGTKYVLDAESGGALLPATHHVDTSTPGQPTNVTVLGPDNAADAIVSSARLESGDVVPSSKKSKKKRRASGDLDTDVQNTEPLGPATANDGNSVAIDEDEEQTMGERLVALGIVDRLPSNGEGAGTAVVAPRADSVQVLLSQALQADDPSLLEQCLAISDEKVISNTIRALRPTEAAKFLSICIVKLETRPRRGVALVPWLRTVLLQHAATLMSNPEMQSVLATLYQLIEARLSVFQPLLALSGRLDLIMAQISSDEVHVTHVTHDSEEAVVVYEEQDSELEVEEVEDGFSSESSDKDAGLEDDRMESEEEAQVKPQGNGNGHLVGADSDGD